MIKLVVFDWNGTLLADTRASVESVNQVLKKLGRAEPLSAKKYRATMTLPILDFYANYGFGRDYLKKSSILIQETFHGHYERRAAKARTRKGARKTLSWLKANGIGSIILSNHLASAISLRLENFRLAHLFSEVLANPDIHSIWKEKNKMRQLHHQIRRARRFKDKRRRQASRDKARRHFPRAPEHGNEGHKLPRPGVASFSSRGKRRAHRKIRADKAHA